MARHRDDMWTPEQVGQEAAETIQRLMRVKLKTGKFPVMFAPDVATG